MNLFEIVHYDIPGLFNQVHELNGWAEYYIKSSPSIQSLLFGVKL